MSQINIRGTVYRFILFSSLIAFSLNGYAIFSFEIKATSSTLSGRKVTLSVSSGVGIAQHNYGEVAFKDSKLSIKGELQQPSTFATFSITENGKYISVNFVIDSGINHIVLDFIKGKSPVLTLKSDRKGNLINKEIKEIFDSKAALSKINGYYKLSSELIREILDLQRVHLEKYPNDFASLILLQRLGMSDRSQDFTKSLLATFATFSDELRNTDQGKTFFTDKSELIKSVVSAKVGHQARNFSISTVDDQTFLSKELAGQNYLLVFSATWCGPCQLQLPKIKELYNQFKIKGLKVVYFNDDDDVERWKKHVKTNQLDWINVSERLKPSESKIPRSFGVFAIPTCILVDRTGVIVYNSNEGDADLVQLQVQLKKMK